MKRILSSALLVAAIASSAPAEEAIIQPAVSSLNGKVDYSGGWMESQEGHNFGGSITVPLGDHLGVQADGLYTRVSGRDFFGGAGHFFWRDPNIGLIGVSGGGLHSDGVLNAYQGLVEAEYYFDRFTVGGLAGVGHIAYDVSVPFIDTRPTKFVGTLSASWYAMDNLRLGASYSYFFKNSVGQVEAEYQTPWKGLCFTAEYARGEYDYDHALFGVRFYFGKDKSLKLRHRQDDPPSLMRNMLTSVGTYGAEFNKKGEAFMKALASALNSGAGGPYGVTVTAVGSPTDYGAYGSTTSGSMTVGDVNVIIDGVNYTVDVPSGISGLNLDSGTGTLHLDGTTMVIKLINNPIVPSEGVPTGSMFTIDTSGFDPNFSSSGSFGVSLIGNQ